MLQEQVEKTTDELKLSLRANYLSNNTSINKLENAPIIGAFFIFTIW